MSAFCDVNVECTSEEAIKKALARMGYTDLRLGRQNLTGYKGDQRDDLADITIDRKHLTSASNDLGFRNEDGKWKMIIS